MGLHEGRFSRLALVVVAALSGALSASFARAQEDVMRVTGAINDMTPFVEVPLTVEQPGSTVVLDLRPTGGDLDPMLYLVDSTGTIVAENDDRSRTDHSSRIAFPRADAGQYTVVATRYDIDTGKTQGAFELVAEVLESAPTRTPAYHISDDDLLAAGFPAVTPRPVADWTILVYYGGDTNLEPSVLNDFDEFELAGGSDEQVRVVLLLDRHPDFVTDPTGNWYTSRLFEVGPDVSHDHDTVFPPTIDTKPLADLGELDTGSGEALAQYLVWGIRNYPARHYAVALGSHGAGWQGLITDDSNEYDILSVPELRAAFSAALAATGLARFDVLINDACLMSSVEYHAATAPFFVYSLASPEIVVNPALDMTLFTEGLKADSAAVDLNRLGVELIDTYIDRDVLASGSVDGVWYTNAMIDLERFSPVAEAVERFAAIVNANPDAYAMLLGEARAKAYTYTFFMGGTTRIDLGNFMRQVVAFSDDAELTRAAEDTLAALEAARLYGNAGERASQRVTYYNIYFPETRDDFRTSYFDESPLPQWAEMLRNFYDAFTPRVWTGRLAAPRAGALALSEGTDATLKLSGAGDDVAYATLTVDQVLADGTVVRLVSQRLGLDALSAFSWDNKLYALNDGTSTGSELLNDAGVGLFYLEGRYREPGAKDWIDVVVIFDADGNVVRIISRYPGSDALGVIEIPEGSGFQAYRSVVTPDGRVTMQPGAAYTWPKGGPTFTEQPAPPGEYNVGVTLTTFGGGTQSSFAPVEVGGDDQGAGGTAPQGATAPTPPLPPLPGAGSGTCTALKFNHVSLQYRDGGLGSISLEWTPEPGAALYRLSVSGGQDYVLGGVGAIIPVSDLDGMGVHSFQVTALDAGQNPICQTDTGFFEVPADAPIAVDTGCHGTFVVVLLGSPYGSSGDLSVSDDFYDGRGQDLKGRCTLTIHGNDSDNLLYGSDGNDTIYGYAGNDVIYGEGGDDFIDGGNEMCDGVECQAGDMIDGGDGNDVIYGGDETCYGEYCNAGDYINGDTGNDVIYGGDETCEGYACWAWDEITGGDGTDVINGGDESCDGDGGYCAPGDFIYGGEGDDVIDGGNETCDGVGCLAYDVIYGGSGDDVIDGGNESCNGDFCVAGEVIFGEDGADTINGGDETCTGDYCIAGDAISASDETGVSDGEADTIDGGEGDNYCNYDPGEGDTATNCNGASQGAN